jgi:hypothetical protein
MATPSKGVGRGTGGGGYREGGGRPKGSTNYRSRQIVVEAVRNGDIMPLDLLLSVVRDNELPLKDRVSAAAIAAPFCHPRLTAQVVGYLDPSKMSDEELLASLRYLEAKAAEVEAHDDPPPRWDAPANPAPGAVIRPASEGRPPVPVLPVRRPGAAPAEAEGRHLLFDPSAGRLKSVAS